MNTNYIVGINKETLKAIFTPYWSLEYPEYYIHRAAEDYVPKESIIKKDELLELLLNSEPFLNDFNKFLQECIKHDGGQVYFVNKLLDKWLSKLIINLPNYKEKKEAIFAIVKKMRNEEKTKEAKKQLNTAKSIFRKAGVKIKILK